jgi:glycosyltransferase involved in cell wall biosynthesis
LPKVSVIIPNYNHAQYLKQRIDSVFNQTYKDFEVIILDDCSTDNSKEIIERYRDNDNVKHIVYNTENSGSTFNQWHKGIGLASGDYIWIAESDDWCETNFLKTIVDGLDKNDDAVFGYCQSFCINDEGGIIFQSNYTRLDDYCPSQEYLEKFMGTGNAVYNASMAVFRKKYYYQISDHYRSFRYCGDWVFWGELSRMGPVYISAKPLNYFRKHADDVTGRMNKSGENFIEEISVLDYFHEHLHLSDGAYFKSKVKLYSRFIQRRNKIDAQVRKKIQSLFFDKISFAQKQYFMLVTKAYRYKLLLQKK